MSIAVYQPRGLGHRILQMLSSGPATLADLAPVVDRRDNRKRRKVAWHALSNLMGHGLVDSAGAYNITPEGEDALQQLECGHTFEIRPRYYSRSINQGAAL